MAKQRKKEKKLRQSRRNCGKLTVIIGKVSRSDGTRSFLQQSMGSGLEYLITSHLAVWQFSSVRQFALVKEMPPKVSARGQC